MAHITFAYENLVKSWLNEASDGELRAIYKAAMNLLPNNERTNPRSTRTAITEWLMVRHELWVDGVFVEVHVKKPTTKPTPKPNAPNTNTQAISRAN